MLKTILNYVNKDNQDCHVLIDENEVEVYVFNTSTLIGFEPHFTDGMEGIFEFVSHEIEYIYEVSQDYLEVIHDYLMDENNSNPESYKTFYDMFMEYYNEEKGSDEK